MLNASVRFMSAALIALILCALPALALENATPPTDRITASQTDTPTQSRALTWIVLAVSLGIAGTVTVTYNFLPQGTTTPVSSTVAPTLIQALGFNSLAAVVEMSTSADSTATITHNWGQSTNQVTLRQPWISAYQTAGGTGIPVVTFSVANTNAVVMGKATTDGATGTWVVILQRPNTIVT